MTWTSVTDDVEDIIEKLRKIAKTSSGSVLDKGELIFRDDDEAEASHKDALFEIVDDDADVMEADLDEDDDDDVDGHYLNPFDDLD